jgi:hypothetical protein
MNYQTAFRLIQDLDEFIQYNLEEANEMTFNYRTSPSIQSIIQFRWILIRYAMTLKTFVQGEAVTLQRLWNVQKEAFEALRWNNYSRYDSHVDRQKCEMIIKVNYPMMLTIEKRGDYYRAFYGDVTLDRTDLIEEPCGDIKRILIYLIDALVK